MADTDGSVVIKVDLSVDDAERELERLKKRIIQTESSISESKYKKSALQKQFEEAEAAYEKLYKTARRDSKGEWLPSDAAALEAAEKKATELREEMNKVDEEIRKGSISLDAMKNRYGEVSEMAQKLRENESGEETEDPFENAKRNVENNENNFVSGLKQVPGKAFDLLKRGLSSVASGVKTAFSKGLQFVKAFGSGIASVAKGIVGFVSKLNVFKSMSNALSGTLSRLGRLVKQAFVFNVVTRGLNMLRDTIGSYLSQNDAVMNAVRQLKSAFLAAFQPIYNAVVPILTTIINLITRIVSAAASFIATIFGKTTKQAQAGADALSDESSALKDTGESAEEAAGSLAGFDEINTIATENTGGSGGRGSGTGIDAISVPLDTDVFDSWGAAFSGMLDKMIAGIPLLETAFTEFAGWLNQFSLNVLNMFTFPGVTEKVVQLGTDLANAFNLLVSSIDWTLLGQALGAGINLAIQFLRSLIFTFDWINLGLSLANAINGIVSQIDWFAFGELLWSGFKIGIELLTGFLLGLDMTQIALAASNLILGFVQSVSQTIQTIDWKAVGDQITTLFNMIQWSDLAQAAGDFLTNFLNAVSLTIQSIDWKALADQIIAFFNAVPWDDLVQSALNFVSSFFQAITNFITEGLPGLLETVANLIPLMVDALIQGVGMFVDAALQIITALANGLLSAIPTLIEALPHIIESLINGLLEAIPKIIQTGITLLTSLTQNLPTIINSIVQAIPQIIQGIIQALSQNIPQIIQAGFDLLTSLITNLPQILITIVGAIPDIIFGIVDALVKSIPEIVNVGAQIVVGLWNGICSLAGWLWDQISGWVSGIWNSIVGFFTGGSSGGSSGSGASGGARTVSYRAIPEIPVLPVPRLATGAVIPPNREFMAVLGDQRYGNNIEAPENLIRSIVNEGNDQIIDLLEQLVSAVRAGRTMYVDKKVLAKTAVDGINSMTRQAGKPVLLV